MAWIRTIEADEASPELSRLYAQVEDPETGQLDNVMKIHSLHPEGLAAHFSVYSSSMAGTKTLRRVERELIAVVVSGLNQCHY